MSGHAPRCDEATAADGEIVRAVLAGEKEAFSALVRRHQTALFRYAHTLGVSPELAEDLVQDAFVRAFTRLRQCRDADRFRAWLVSIFRNLVLDDARSRQARELPLAIVENAPASVGTPPEVGRAVARALDELPELLREAFLLRHHHGYAYDEIATITGAKMSAVKMRVHRAREQLRAALEDEAVHA